jgi:PAS domain-containing protein
MIADRDVSLLVGRFDTAFNNMPHGLCMVDVKGQVVVCNRRLRELLSLPENVTRRRLPVRVRRRGLVKRARRTSGAGAREPIGG